LQTVLFETDFESPKAYKMIRELLQSGASGAVDAVAGSGHMYAAMYVNAGLKPSGRMAEQTGGLTQVKLIARLAAAEENPEAMKELVQKLKAIQAIAVNNMKTNMRVALTCGVDSTGPNEQALKQFLNSASAANFVAPEVALNTQAATYPSSGNTFFNMPYQVSYSALGLPTVPYVDPRGASYALLAALLTHKHLHHEIREKGGAYGAFAYSRPVNGIFTMSSYRDPNPENTINVMKHAGRWAAERAWTAQELEEAKLTVFQGIDAPMSVSAEGLLRFEVGVTREMEQERRERLLDVTREDVRKAAEDVVKGLDEGKGSFVLLGPRKPFVDEANGWKVEDMAKELAEKAA
jgi:Zn-dependent M16 (insulinase) family peptidase